MDAAPNGAGPNLLNLPGYEILGVSENPHDFHVRVRSLAPRMPCPHCHMPDTTGFGQREQLIHDLPTLGKRVGLYVQTRRFRCRGCRKTFYEPLPGANGKRLMTDRLVRWIGEQSLKRAFLQVAEDVGLSEKTVRQVFSDYAARLAREHVFETPRWMGIDEVHLIRPRGVIANIETRTVVELLSNRNQATILEYLRRLMAPENVQCVTMDMWRPYRDAVRQVLPKAAIIVDKFHVLRMANAALEQVRKAHRASLSAKARRTLKDDRFILLKRPHDLTDEEAFRLDGWLKNYPVLGEAYQLKERFYGIYDAGTRIEAKKLYAEWAAAVPESFVAFQPILTAFGNWSPEIFAYFDHRLTNAYTESLNNLIRAMNRLGRGYSFEVLRAKILYTQGFHLTRRPKFKRRDERVFYQVSTWAPQSQAALNFGADLDAVRNWIERLPPLQ